MRRASSTAGGRRRTAPVGRGGVLALLAGGLVATLVVGALATALWWRADGGRWYVVSTPSMGTALPVGTLVLTTPTDVADVAEGDVVTFRAPRTRTAHTHRVVATDGSRLTTQGDLNDVPDGGSTGQDDLVGRVVWHAPGLGWALRAVPLLVVGGALTWLLGLALPPRLRRPARLLGLSVTLAVTNYLLHPWVGLERVSQRPSDDGGTGLLLDVVSVGLLPVRAEQVGGGAAATLRTGELVTLPLAHRDHGAYDVVSVLQLPWWGWALVGATCLAPMGVALLVGRAPAPTPGRHLATPSALAGAAS